jgi:hypothetical protein
MVWIFLQKETFPPRQRGHVLLLLPFASSLLFQDARYAVVLPQSIPPVLGGEPARSSFRTADSPTGR